MCNTCNRPVQIQSNNSIYYKHVLCARFQYVIRALDLNFEENGNQWNVNIFECLGALVLQYFISEFTSIIQYIQTYSCTGFDSKLKLIFKSFPITMWIMQNLYENGTGNQCALSNININAWQIKRRKKKMLGEWEGTY